MSRRIRTLKPEWLDDEKLARASRDARLLSAALLLLADDYGNGRAAPVWITMQVYGYEMETSGDPREIIASVSRALRELVEIGYLRLYIVGDQHYFGVVNWAKHQKVDHPGPPRVPGPDAGKPASPEALREPVAKASREPREPLAPDQYQDQEGIRTGTPLARAREEQGAGHLPGLDPLDADPRPVARGVDAARTAAGLAPSFPGGTVGMADQRRIGEAWARIVAGAAHHGVSVEEFCRRSFGAFLERSPGRGVAVWLTDPCAPLDDAAGQEPPAAPKSDLVLAYERARDAVDHGRARGYGPEKMRELEDIERAARKAKNTRQPKGVTAT